MAHRLAVGLLIFTAVFFTACSLEGDPESLRTIVPGSSLTAKLNWLQEHAASDKTYNIEVEADESISPYVLSFSGRSGVTVHLLGDATMRTVSVSGSGSLFTVKSGVTLILGNNITLSGHSDNDASLVTVYGQLIMRKGSLITGNNTSEDGGGVCVDGGTFTMEGGEITGNTAPGGGGVYVDGGTFTMKDGEIADNTVSGSGGGVYMNSGVFTMKDGKIAGNAASDSGGGVYAYYGTFMMNGGKIYNNTSPGGGGVESLYDGNFTMTGGEIYDNTSIYGGGVRMYGGTFTMKNGKIAGNTADNGAGVYMFNCDFTMENGEIVNNTASGPGGGVYVDGGTFTMKDGKISGNTASGGGGVYINSGKFTKNGGTIYGYAPDESNSNISNNGNGLVEKYRGHAVYAVNNIMAKRKETTAGSTDNLSFNATVNPPAWSGEWDDEKVTAIINLTSTYEWEQANLLEHTIELTGSSSRKTYYLTGESELIIEINFGLWDINVKSFLDGDLFARGSTNANLKAEQDNYVSVMIHRIGSVSVNIEFTGIPKQTVDLTSNTEKNLYWNDLLIVTAAEEFESYTLYLDGSYLTSTGSNNFELVIEDKYYYFIGIHSLLVIAVKDNIPYSVELIFRIAYKEGL